MKVLLLPRYSSNGASSRLRFYQLVPGLGERSIRCEIQPFFEPEYLERLYRSASPIGDVFPYRAAIRLQDLVQFGRALVRRVRTALSMRRFDVVVVEKELLPGLPLAIEWPLIRLARKLVTDHDDAIGVQYRDRPLLRGKIERLMAMSDAVVVGNQVLEGVARAHSRRVHLLPTVVDPARYPVKEHTGVTERPVVVGWVGTPVTALFLRPVLPLLERLAGRLPIRLLLIGAGDDFQVPGPWVRKLAWRLETEGSDLLQMDIGIMPLPDDAFSRAKSGYKLVQYMAAGLPSVASPVGENRRLVVPGKTGFLAMSEAEWELALERLCRDACLRAEMGRAGRRRVESEYSLAHGVDAYARVLEEVRVLPAAGSASPARRSSGSKPVQ